MDSIWKRLLIICAFLMAILFGAFLSTTLDRPDQDKDAGGIPKSWRSLLTSPGSAADASTGPGPVTRDGMMKKWFADLGEHVKGSLSCPQLLPPKGTADFKGTYKTGGAAFQQAFKRSLGGTRAEGYSAEVAAQTWVYHVMARNEFVTTVCETGFNGGHSTFVWLSSHPASKVISFDLGSHPYAHLMAEYLSATYPARLTVVFGDSTTTLPLFKERIKLSQPNFKCDIIVVDGGHTYPVAKADMDNFRSLAIPGHSLVVLDDYPSGMFPFGAIGKVWEEQRKEKKIAELFRCTTGKRGFTVGYFL